MNVSEDEAKVGESPVTATPTVIADKPRSKRGMVVLLGVVLLIAAAVLGIWIYNQTTLQKPLQRVLASDPRNKVVHASAHFDGWVNTDTVVFNLDDISGDSSAADIFRSFLQYAREQKEHHFRQVFLSAYGQKKFVIPGDYFQQLGKEFDTQNPLYTMRTFAHHVSAMDGSHPFPELQGGWLGVMGEEMQQFSDFNKRWFMDDYISRHK
jgi:hypothetical protein